MTSSKYRLLPTYSDWWSRYLYGLLATHASVFIPQHVKILLKASHSAVFTCHLVWILCPLCRSPVGIPTLVIVMTLAAVWILTVVLNVAFYRMHSERTPIVDLAQTVLPLSTCSSPLQAMHHTTGSSWTGTSWHCAWENERSAGIFSRVGLSLVRELHAGQSTHANLTQLSASQRMTTKHIIGYAALQNQKRLLAT